ncbi:hypothetical protein [Thiomicrolovo sp. ZZH C-3]
MQVNIVLDTQKTALDLGGQIYFDATLTFTLTHHLGKPIEIGEHIRENGVLVKPLVRERILTELMEYLQDELDEEYLGRLIHAATIKLPEKQLLANDENDNCLKGVVCPVCGNQTSFIVHASMWCDLQDDGTNPFGPYSGKEHGGTDYDDNSSMKCCSCSYQGRLRDFRVDAEKGCYEVEMLLKPMDIARLGSVALYEMVDEAVQQTYGVSIETVAMTMKPISIEEKAVRYRCTPTSHTKEK